MKIFSGQSNEYLAKEIAEKLNLSLSPLEIHVFPDGEKRVMVGTSVLDQQVIVVYATAPEVDESYMELFFIIDAVKRSGAKSITLVAPYLGYQRQDHVFRIGEARSFAVIAKILEDVGVDRLITVDLHSIKISELFTIPVVHLSALSLFKEIIKKNFAASDYVLISPDMGGVRRIKMLSEMLGGVPFASIEKQRDLITGKVSSKTIHGQLRGQAIIVDDMISTGETIAAAASVLKKNNVGGIFVFATHPVFSQNANLLLEHAPVEKVYVTDTIAVPKEKQFPKLQIVSIAGILGEALFKQ